MNPKLRVLAPTESPFVLSAWLKSFRNAPAVIDVANDIYFAEQAHLILAALDTQACIVACDPEDPNIIWGFVVGNKTHLSYIYVKHSLRRHGIAKLLWEALGSPSTVTALTQAGRDIISKHSNLVYNPYEA